MLVIPAIDLRGGKCVRLVEGKLENETVFSDDPVAMARHWAAQGAELLHVVDLDGAFQGKPQNLPVAAAIAEAVSIPVQLGGGIRSLAAIKEVLALGMARVVLGTTAITAPGLVEEACALYGEKIIVGIDARDGKVATEGWTVGTGTTPVDLARRMQEIGVKRLIFTDIRRDGTLQGPNLAAMLELAQAAGIPVIASGGVAALEDLRQLKELEPYGIEGVIIGKAIYTGAVDLRQALAIA